MLVCDDDKSVDKMWDAVKSTGVKKVVQYLGEPKRPGVLSWQELMQMGEDDDNDELEQRQRDMAINKCCTLIYTSGTTGNPKGVMLSHDNICFTSEAALKETDWRMDDEIVVSYLPLSHIAAYMVDIMASLGIAGTVYFADKGALKGTLVDTLREVTACYLLVND